MRKVVWMAGLSFILVLAANYKISNLFSKAEAPSQEVLLAVRMIDLDQDGQVEKIIKTQNKHVTKIQVYHLEGHYTDVTEKLVGEYQFPHSRESFIFFKTSITNLAFADTTGDGHKEIIVSYFDEASKKSNFYLLKWDKAKHELIRVEKEN